MTTNEPTTDVTPKPLPPARCLDCQNQATNQAVFLRSDGTHFLGSPVCDAHQYPAGLLQHSHGVEIVDYMEVLR